MVSKEGALIQAMGVVVLAVKVFKKNDRILATISKETCVEIPQEKARHKKNGGSRATQKEGLITSMLLIYINGGLGFGFYMRWTTIMTLQHVHSNKLVLNLLESHLYICLLNLESLWHST